MIVVIYRCKLTFDNMRTGTRKTEGVTLNRKRANAAGGSILYINKEKLHGHFDNPNTPCKKVFYRLSLE
jgi:hypothetical protein